MNAACPAARDLDYFNEAACFPSSFMHFDRKCLRAFPCRPFASACLEHSIDPALRGLVGFAAICCTWASAVPPNATSTTALSTIIDLRIFQLHWQRAIPCNGPECVPISPSTACCIRCSSRHPSRSSEALHCDCQLCWPCIDQGTCAFALFPQIPFEYFGEMALGNIAFVVVAGIAAGAAAPGVAEAFAPQLALRKACHVIPPTVPAACSALYLALHSFIVSAATGSAAITLMVPNSTAVPTHARAEQRQHGDLLDVSSGQGFAVSTIVIAPEQRWYRDDTGYLPVNSTEHRSEFRAGRHAEYVSLGARVKARLSRLWNWLLC